MADNSTTPSGLPTLDQLPDEVLQQILFFLSPKDILLTIQRTSKRFNRLGGEPLLWRYHCQTEYHYWDSKHRIRQKYSGGVGDVDWKTLHAYRKNVDLKTTALLDSILRGQTDRIQQFKAIADFGYDAKDTLLRHCRADEDAEDFLARRWAWHARICSWC